jgi:tripartite-type tricarboxylate transporter receptor subunit TctC
MTRLHRRHLLGLAASLPVALPALAQSRPLKLVVPYPPGGPTDALGRLAAQAMGAELGQNIVVENVSGAAGTVGTRNVARAEADGATLLLGSYQTHATAVVMMSNLPYDPLRDFTPIAGLAELQHVLVVRNGLAARSVAELIALAKAEPGKLNYGSTGAGSLSHLGMEVFKRRTGTELVHVPFSGSSPLVIELMAERIDVSFATIPPVLGQLRDNKMRPLAIASGVKAPQLPNMPLLRDVGVQGSEADSWLALFIRSGAPAGVAERLSAAALAAFRKPEVQARAVELGMVVNLRDQATLGRFVAEELSRWGEVIRAANLRMEG